MKLAHSPTSLIVDQTTLCNEACDFCWRRDATRVADVYREQDYHTMPFATFERIARAAAECDTVRTLNLCGPMGDASLVPDLVERGLLGRELGYSVRMLNTNGVALHKHDPVKLLEAFNGLKVSLDTLDPEKYAFMHGRDNLRQVVANIERLAGYGTFGLKVTETKDNRDEVPKIRDWARQLQLGFYLKPLHSFIDVVEGQSIAAAWCDQPFAAINFNFRGELTTCCINHHLEPTFGTLDDGSLKALWEGVAFTVWRDERLEGLCRGCSGLGPDAARIRRALEREATH